MPLFLSVLLLVLQRLSIKRYERHGACSGLLRARALLAGRPSQQTDFGFQFVPMGLVLQMKESQGSLTSTGKLCKGLQRILFYLRVSVFWSN
jgi:hypothetical protein